MKRNKSSHKSKLHGNIAAGVILLVIIAAAVLITVFDRYKEESPSDDSTVSLNSGDSDDGSSETADFRDLSVELGQGITVTGMGSYSGTFYEDSSGDEVSDVLALRVKNNSENYLEYIEFELTIDGTSCEFSLSTLPAGQTAVILEKNRCEYKDTEVDNAEVSACAFFETAPTMQEDRFTVTTADNIINVENISDEDVSGDVLVYYKTNVGGIYYGGTTYRVRIEGGVPAGEIRQVSAVHFDSDSSEILFVTSEQ